MADWIDLTREQQQLVLNFVDVLLRPWAGEQARVSNHADVLNTDYNGQIGAILATLTSGVVIPNDAGLAGAASLTKDEIITIVSHAQGVLASYNTSGHRQMWAKAAGAQNLIG